MSSRNRKPRAKRQLDQLIRSFAPAISTAHQPFWRLITAIRSSSRLLVPVPNRGHYDPSDIERIVRACARMAKHRKAWRRQPEQWTAPDANPFVQFRSLVSHLFDEYTVPRFMASVWLDDYVKPWWLALYLHLAAGRSLRQFRSPVSIPVTRRAAALFMQAPDDLRPIEAIRWAQIRSLGGDDRLARLLLSRTLLAGPTEHEPFWESVIRFLVANTPIPADVVVAVVSFIHQQRFQPAETVWGRGAGEQSVQPDFSLQGRTLMSLRRHMANWRTELLPRFPQVISSMPSWTPSPIRPFRCETGDTLWTIDELLTDRELRIEGSIMQHCVATYISDCARRATSIWSMKMQQGERRRRALTIEVLPNSRIVWQAKGKKNSDPSEFAGEILRRWADQEGLQLRA